ncbi:hypothetical protein JM93_00617 [Roseibium hamelinense]|uniref:DUF2846 domain-containing protein n=1 Tax=Roseibium hamelinense TaxID=150831 RepID=A0A562TI74_9HYPH|nr:hypothetical protein [Roseibium hamelinense]MTI45754.1 hypothetical protein [Roseibium hamelinense]TWI93063.1 hypothetical protein JM93_00617 [Roseibium hamelinense]
MFRFFQVMAMIAIACTAAKAEALPETGDVFMISRGANGTFLGSHKIFLRESDGLVQVTYCGREYWVRPKTVAWSELEIDNRHDVRVEFNKGRGWMPICNRPTQYVTLKDLGITMDPVLIVRSNGEELKRVNRFSAVSESFRKGDRSLRGQSTFHDRAN